MGRSTSLQITQIGPGFVGEASGLDISSPLTPDDISAINAGMDEYAVLIFRDQNLTNDQQVAFTNALINDSGDNVLVRPDRYIFQHLDLIGMARIGKRRH